MIISAGDINKGILLAENDGFLWEVTEILKETDKIIIVRLNSDFSSFKEHWKGNKGIVKRFNKTSKVMKV